PDSGGPIGDPEPLTTNFGNLGWARVSADGQRLVASVYELSASLELYRVVPDVDPPVTFVRALNPRSLRWCRLSPDAVWLACSTIGAPEDLVLLRADGSELRRLTDDDHKDRNILWSRDGERLLFMSTRSGGWAMWSVRADGSELRQLTDFSISKFFWGLHWSLDGQKIIVPFGAGKLGELPVNELTTERALRTIDIPGSSQTFIPGPWSPSGGLLAVTEINERGEALSVGAIELTTGTYDESRLAVSRQADWNVGGWLPDSRYFVARGTREIALVDSESGDWRRLVATTRPNTSFSLSDDGILHVEPSSEDGDIWLLERTGGER
ncbi:MAG TPA: hypothetical protein VEK15_08330, partial [Vicinamibacteria bacterium]|nr:hypothetical protein [Vicinamibacteria bacterium]